MTSITHTSSEGQNYFAISNGAQKIGILTYSMPTPGVMVIDHTEVDADHQGKGLARQLVMAAVNFAKENNLKVNPLCPYADRVFKASPELSAIRN